MTKRRITPHKGGRTARAPGARLTPQERERLKAVLRHYNAKYIDWLIDHIEIDYAEITGDDTMADKFVYGWYHYADGTDKEFRYPASGEDNLKRDGMKVTVDVKDGGKWAERKGTVVWGGGNYTVTPR